MRLTFSKKQIALLIYTAIISASNMFMKPILEACRMIYNFDESNVFHTDVHIGQIVVYNYLLALHYIIMFVILTVCIVKLVSLNIKSTAFLSLYKEGRHGEINDLSSLGKLEKMLLIDRFETANDLIWTTDAFVIAALMCIISALFCTFDDRFKGILLWADDPARAGSFSLFPGWVFELFAVPNTNMSDYAIIWLLPMFVVIIVLTIRTYYKFYKAKKAFCSVFPDVPNERFLEPLIILKRHGRGKDLDEPLFSQDYNSINKQGINVYLRQEDIDREENNFFATEDPPPKIEPTHESVQENDEEQELIPDELDLSGLKLQPKEQEKGDDLIPCPLCGSLNLESAEECFFCGGKINK